MFKKQRKLLTCFTLSVLILSSESNVYAAVTGQNNSNPDVATAQVEKASTAS